MKSGPRNSRSRNKRPMAPDDWHQPGQTAMFNWFRQSSKSAPRIVPRAVAFQAVVPEAKPLTPAPLNVPSDVLAQLSLQAQRILLRMPAETRPLHCAKEHPWMLDRLLASWDSPATFRRQLSELLIDTRGNRQGFSFDALAELSALGDYYDTYVNPRTEHGWATVDRRFVSGPACFAKHDHHAGRRPRKTSGGAPGVLSSGPSGRPCWPSLYQSEQGPEQ